MNVRRKLFVLGRIERKAKPILQCGQERFRRPAMLQEQKFEASALAVLAEHFRFPKELRHTAYHGDNLLPLHESIETNAEVRIRGKATSHAQRKANFLTGDALARNRSEADIIDSGI